MIGLDQLSQAVAQAIAAGGVGRPVFVRCVARALPEPDSPALLTDLAQAVERWVGDRIASLYAVAAGPGIPNTLCLSFRRGATALVSSTNRGSEPPSIDLIVLGNHGAIYHEGLSADPGQARLGEAERPGAHGRLRELVDRALRTGAPQSVAAEGDE